MDLAIIDLDGVVADSTARFARARRSDGSIDWAIAFDSDLVALDTLIPHALGAIRRLASGGYEVIFLTSRPQSMRDATQAWLDVHALDGYGLIMKPAHAQFIKTAKWKADEVARMAQLPGVTSLLFVDDEERNREAVEARQLPHVTTIASLSELVDDRPIII